MEVTMNTGFKFPVQPDVPLPKPFDSRCKYPWRLMEVGDSFFVPVEASGDPHLVLPAIRRVLSAVRSGIVYRHKKSAERFTCRRDESGVRVWRTE